MDPSLIAMLMESDGEVIEFPVDPLMAKSMRISPGIYIYDPATNSWSDNDNLAVPQQTAILLGNRLAMSKGTASPGGKPVQAIRVAKPERKVSLTGESLIRQEIENTAKAMGIDPEKIIGTLKAAKRGNITQWEALIVTHKSKGDQWLKNWVNSYVKLVKNQSTQPAPQSPQAPPVPPPQPAAN